MSSTASTSSISSFYTENGVTRLNGSELMSGLDTQKLIDAMTAKTQSKIDRQNSLEQVATWRREMYREVESLMQKLSDDYFSFASDTNILSSTFFSSLDLVSSSPAVSATGTASNAGNVVVNSVSQTAKAAVYTTQSLSGVTTIQSGELRTGWAQSAVGGKSLVVGYGGKQYTLTVDSSVTLDSGADGADVDVNANLTKITDNLNKQIASSDELNGHVEFSAENGKVTLKSTDGTTDVSVTAYRADKDDTSGEAFLTALGLNGKSAAATITGDAVTMDTGGPLFNQTVSSASYLNLKVGENEYKVYLGTDEDGNPLDLSNVSSTDEVANAVAQQLQSQIEGNPDLKDKVSVTSSDGKITIGKEGEDVVVSGGSENLLKGLGLQADGGTYQNSGDVNKAALTKSYLGDTLAGSTVSFTLDGVTKAVSFSESEKDEYDEAGEISDYLQKKLDTAFGNGKITVTEESGRLAFSAADSTSVLKIASASASGVLGEDGALRLRYGAVNRLDTTMTLRELAEEFPDLKSSDSGYSLTVNGKSFTFDENAELGTVLSTISNDPDAGVNIQYSQTGNRFRILADDTGAQGRVSVQGAEGGGDLASVLHLATDEDAVTINTGEITNLSPESGSTYSLSVGGGQEFTFTIAGGTYDSINSLKNAAQEAIDKATGVPEKVLVGVSTDESGKNHLTFNSTDGSSLSLAKSSESTGDILNLGSGSITSTTGFTAGQDLKMNVTLGGGETQDITRSTNSFDLDGLHLTVTGTTEAGAEPIQFSSSGDVDDLVDKISAFVDEYNKLIDKANQYTSEMPYGLDAENGTNTKYGPLTDAQKEDMTDDEIEEWNEKAKQGLLQNDNTLNSILSDMREAVLEPVQSAGLSLSAVGISTTSDVLSGGKLAVDKTALKSALQSDPDRVAGLFTNTDGVAGKIKEVIEKNIGAFGNSGALIDVAGKDGMVGADNSQLSRQISDYESNVKKLQTQLQTEKSHWLAKFTTMETKLSALTSQYDYLSSVLSGSGS